jgi:hypothetical protein
VTGALAEALVAAQRRAMQAVEKAYVAGALEREAADAELQAVGATDAVDRSALLDALDTLRRYGAPLPAEPRPNGDTPEPAKATAAQVTFAQDLFKRGDLVPLAESDLRNLPRERISALIEQLKAGTYDASEWDVPF